MRKARSEESSANNSGKKKAGFPTFGEWTGAVPF
jgi:hypothetical protein